MAFAAAALFEQVADATISKQLSDLCRAQGIESAASLAMMDAEMAAELLEGEEASLMAPLLAAVERARPLIPGWRKAVAGLGDRGGAGSGGGPVLSHSPPPAAPKTGETPARPDVLVPQPGPAVGALGTCAATQRADRLLRGFTRGLLRRKQKTDRAPPPHLYQLRRGRGPGLRERRGGYRR